METMTAEESKYFETGGNTEIAEAPVETPQEVTEVPQELSPAPKAETAPLEQPQEQRQEKTVPLAALHEERARRKEMQAQINRMEQAYQEVLKRAQPQQEQPKGPAFEEDPINYLRQENYALQQKLQQYDQRFGQMDQQQQLQEQRNAFENWYKESADRFSQTTPDFKDAYKYLINSRGQELMALGYNRQEAEMLIRQEEANLASKAYQDEVNPGERLYAWAKQRGYSAPKPQVQQNQQVDQNLKLDTIEKGQKAAKTLNGGGGKSANELSLESLAELDGEEFNAAWEKMSKMFG